MRRRRGRPGTGHPLCRARPPTGTLIDTAPFPVPAGCVVLEDSPSPVYGAALLMRFGSDPIRGSNPRSSAERRSMLVELRSTAPRPQYLPGGGGRPPGPPVSAAPAKAGWAPPVPASPTKAGGRLPCSTTPGAGSAGKSRVVPAAPAKAGGRALFGAAGLTEGALGGRLLAPTRSGLLGSGAQVGYV
jgi:hypothetical protein